jgi:hypothetical protein
MTPFLINYLLSVLETVQSKSKGQAAADASSYITLCYSNSIFIVVAVILQYALGYTGPLPIFLQSESCESPSRGSSFCFAFSGHIRADSDAKCHGLYECFHRKWNDVLLTKPKSTYIKAKIQSKRPSRKYQRSLLHYLLSSIHWSYHITSKFATSSRTESNFLRQSSGTSPCK